jgi:hypothetical protein
MGAEVLLWQYAQNVNKKFLGVQNPFYKKGFGCRRHQQFAGPGKRRNE